MRGVEQPHEASRNYKANQTEAQGPYQSIRIGAGISPASNAAAAEAGLSLSRLGTRV